MLSLCWGTLRPRRGSGPDILRRSCRTTAGAHKRRTGSSFASSASSMRWSSPSLPSPSGRCSRIPHRSSTRPRWRLTSTATRGLPEPRSPRSNKSRTSFRWSTRRVSRHGKGKPSQSRETHWKTSAQPPEHQPSPRRGRLEQRAAGTSTFVIARRALFRSTTRCHS